MPDSVATHPAKIQLPVEVIGPNLHGQQFFERTETLTIARNAVTILLKSILAADAEVIIRNPETDEEAVACAVGVPQGDGSAHIYKFIFTDSTANIWHLQFPAAEPPKLVQLECSGCHTVSSHSLSEGELELFESARQLVRPCKGCNSLRTWKDPAREAAPRKRVGPPKQDPIPAKAASSPEERRKNRRTAMKMTACIRFSGLEDVVNCEDISKGGFRFSSPKEYPEGTRVEVAVPYAESGLNIFSQAIIKHCVKKPDGEFCHGVSHVKNSGSIGWDP